MKVFYFENMNQLEISINNSKFINFNVSNRGGIFYLSEIGSITLLNNVFINNNANYGGVIYYQNSQGKFI